MIIFKGSVGDEIILNTGHDLEDATKIEMRVITPSGSNEVWDAVAHATPEHIVHTTLEGEMVDEGIYIVRAYVEWEELHSYLGKPVLVHCLDISYVVPINEVRRTIQDKNPDRPLLSDEEIYDSLAASGGDTLAASLACAEALVARGAHKVSKKIGDRQINYSDLLGHYQALVEVLQAKIQQRDFSHGTYRGGKVEDKYPTVLSNFLTDL